VKLTDWSAWHALAGLDNVAAGTRSVIHSALESPKAFADRFAPVIELLADT
jgi:hypothetical protein